ncbi:transposase of ISGbem_B, Y1_Tnp domain-containing [Citrifermentans bemidjiense Bem]|uniref:Transposase of ISGbem_B, Y1_Tnp domain-containing n=1 Tax=Citrifermentans bemidjiense (strain ATCC BAA-1014 / DSM 16622 / JCM 12645 / Bem) TaxID=404380 RepID=B5EII0_CITBB|nr:transposase [Citrifermentans bemidjiense]ACH39882.1 transposase of ISGbem_B, Y1_Tnp domain-containing [Citrifermentans bemidjiense Bem]
MARPLRIEFPGAVYHLTSRGNEQKNVFRDDKDRTIFLDILARSCNLFNWLCHAYCLMGNHYHLIVETVDDTLSRGMRHLNGVYTQKFNWNHHSVGHVFQGRYKAILIEKESHLLEACRYVVLNPVRAKLAADPAQWRWSSYKATSGLEKPAACLTTAWILQQFDQKPTSANKKYREFVQDGINARSIWEDLRSQILLGDEDFVEQFKDIAKGVEALTEIPRDQRFLQRPDLQELFSGIDKDNKRLRKNAVIEAIEVHGYAQKDVADHLGLHYSTINRILGNKRNQDS